MRKKDIADLVLGLQESLFELGGKYNNRSIRIYG